MARRRQCKEKGCRKSRAEGSDFCQLHITEAEPSGGNGVGKPEVVFPEDEVLQLSDAELDKFNLHRIKMENTLQAIRVNELELDKLRREFRDQEHNKEQLLKRQREMVEAQNNEYLAYVRGLAKKYKIHPDYLGIDDETGVLRDLEPREEAEPG